MPGEEDTDQPGEAASPDPADVADFAEEHSDTTAGGGLSTGDDEDELEPESPRGLGGMDIPPNPLRDL